MRYLEIEKLGHWLEEEMICPSVTEQLMKTFNDVVSQLTDADRSVVLGVFNQVVAGLNTDNEDDWDDWGEA